ncbi:hypothetical protein V7193_10140 [Bacillus velezensis]
MTKLAFPAILFIPGIVFAGGNGFSLNGNQLKPGQVSGCIYSLEFRFLQLNQKLPYKEQITSLLWDAAENKSLHNRQTDSGIKKQLR